MSRQSHQGISSRTPMIMFYGHTQKAYDVMFYGHMQ